MAARVLEEHLLFTGSPRASRLLSRRNGLPFVRVQPVHLQATIADTWKPMSGPTDASREFADRPKVHGCHKLHCTPRRCTRAADAFTP